MAEVSPWRLRDVVVCAHYGCTFVADVVASAALTDAERRAFLAVDPRAFQADADRRHRAVVALADELPVSIAVAGLTATYALFDREDVFGAVVRGADAMAVVFAAALEGAIEGGGDVARIEGAMAKARRRGQALSRGPQIVARAVGVEVCAVAHDDVIDAYGVALAGLGADTAAIVAAVCGGARVTWPAATSSSPAWILATTGASGVSLARCSPALGAFLGALGDVDGVDGIDLARAIAIATDLGCDDDAEAAALIDGLVDDGLVTVG
jgi:hypothetical protein